MTVRIYYKSTWYQSPPSFMDITECPSVEQAAKLFQEKNPKLEFVSAKELTPACEA